MAKAMSVLAATIQHPRQPLPRSDAKLPPPAVPMRPALRALASHHATVTLRDPLRRRSAKAKDPIDGILSVSDAAALWHLDTSTIRRAIKDGRLVQDLDCYKLGKQWTVTKAAMTRLYGTPKEKDQG